MAEPENHLIRTMPESKPNPDPTIATNEAVARAMKAERDYVDGKIEVINERFAGIDRATALLSDSAAKTPDHIAKVVGHLQTLVDEKFFKVSGQFSERDTRSERESRDNKVAVDAAFAAQKEAAAKQDEANAKAIDKSEKATAETIKTNQELSAAKTESLTKGLDEVKLQVAQLQSQRQGGKEQMSSTVQVVGLILTLLSILGILAASGVFNRGTP